MWCAGTNAGTRGIRHAELESRLYRSRQEGVNVAMIVLILLIIWLVWSVYNGNVYPKQGVIAGGVAAAVYVAGLAARQPALAIIAVIGLAIFLVVRTYDGDVHIR